MLAVHPSTLLVFTRAPLKNFLRVSRPKTLIEVISEVHPVASVGCHAPQASILPLSGTLLAAQSFVWHTSGSTLFRPFFATVPLLDVEITSSTSVLSSAG